MTVGSQSSYNIKYPEGFFYIYLYSCEERREKASGDVERLAQLWAAVSFLAGPSSWTVTEETSAVSQRAGRQQPGGTRGLVLRSYDRQR